MQPNKALFTCAYGVLPGPALLCLPGRSKHGVLACALRGAA